MQSSWHGIIVDNDTNYIGIERSAATTWVKEFNGFIHVFALYQAKHTAAVTTEFTGGCLSGCWSNAYNFTRTTLLVIGTVMQNLDAGEERPEKSSIVKPHIPTASYVPMRNVSIATRTVNELRLSVTAGQLTTELTARATPVVDDVI